jgi:hypothetical protein
MSNPNATNLKKVFKVAVYLARREKINTRTLPAQKKTPRRSEGSFVESYFLVAKPRTETPTNIKNTSHTKPNTNEG